MTNHAYFQTQITTILEIMTKSAIAEITKLFDDTYSVLFLKISRSLHENEALRKKQQLLQHELRTAREQKKEIAEALEEQDRESVFGQECSFSLRRAREPVSVKKFANTEKFRTEPVVIKPERLEEDLCCSYQQPTPGEEEQVTQPTLIEDTKKTDSEPTPVGDPEELSEQRRCGHSEDEELNELEFVVKAEQEEEHVALRFNQTGYEHSPGRFSNLGSEYVMYERDSQLWASFTQGDSDIETDDPVCLNASEQYSQSLSVHTQLQHAPATMELSGNTLSSFGASFVEGLEKMGEKPSVCSKEQQGQYRERLVHTVERENQTLLSQQQQHGPSVKHLRGSESPAQPYSGSQNETGSAVSTSVFNSGKNNTDAQADFGKKPFICVYCGKSFDRWSHLVSHHRIHTGEKPYSCAQCGKCFSHKGNLVQHERVHSGSKPFACTQCGKRFSRGANLRAHHKSHTGEKPFNCTQCGKRFARQRTLVVHQWIHMSETKQL